MGAELGEAFEPAVLALGWTLVHAVWQGALVAALYAALRFAITSARARVALGHAALLALVALPLVTFARRITGGAVVAATGSDPLVVSALAAADAGGFEFERALRWLVVGWGGGVLLLCLRQALQWRELHRLCRRAEPLGGEWPARFAALQARVGVRFRVGLRQSADVALPMLVGILRPTILLPAGLMLRLPADRIELILLHELAHLRRLDPLFNLLQTVVETLLFFHPAVHWMSRRLREDRELCCDEIVLANGADPMRYARVLLTLAETQATPAPALALAASGGVLMHRIERIVDVPAAAQAAAPRTLGPVGVMLGVALLGAVLLQGQARWTALEPLPFGFGPARLVLPALGAPRVADLTPAWSTAVALPRVETTSEPSAAGIDAPPLPAVSRQAVEDAVPLPTLVPLPAPDLALAEPAPLPVALPEPAPASTSPLAAEPRVRHAPLYPRDARKRGREGFVMLTYRIDVDGRPFDIAAEGRPDPDFEGAARAALAQWRFEPAAASMQAQKVRFDFRLDEADAPAPATAESSPRACRPTTGSRLCRPMHDTGVRTVVLSRS